MAQTTTQTGDDPTFNYGYDALDRRITTDFTSSYQGWQQVQHFDGRQERNHYNAQGILRSLDYVPNMQADLYGQLIRQTTHQLDHSAFVQMDNVLKDNLGELYFHQDMLQSTAGVTNAAGQGVMNWFYSISGEAFGYQHGSWMDGHTDASWNTQFAQSFLFTGRYTDPVSNLTHMDARWYSSDLARFTSPDYYNLQQLALPAGARHQLLPYLGKNYQDLLRDPAQQMRYGYVMGNGLTYLDWLGLCSEPNVFVKAIYSTSAAIDGAFDAASFGLYSDLANSAGITTGRNANSTAYQLGQSAVTGAEIGASLGVVPLAKAGVRNLGKQVSRGLSKKGDEAVTQTGSGAVNSATKVKLEKQLASQEQMGQLSNGEGIVISQPAKQADRIAAQTGRNPENIQKVSSDARVASDGQQVQTHSFRDASTNELIEPKTIINE